MKHLQQMVLPLQSYNAGCPVQKGGYNTCKVLLRVFTIHVVDWFGGGVAFPKKGVDAPHVNMIPPELMKHLLSSVLLSSLELSDTKVYEPYIRAPKQPHQMVHPYNPATHLAQDGQHKRVTHCNPYKGVRSHEERRCSILGPHQSRISPSIL